MATRRKFMRDAASLSASAVLAATGGESIFAQTRRVTRGTRPNIVLILADDMGFADLGCYGSEIRTPNLDRLAEGGLRFTQFYNNPRCCPSRASLMTGLYPHQAGMGGMTTDYGKYPFPGYQGDLNDHCVTLAEALRSGGYRTAMSGKWHLTPPELESKHNWPCQRGFEKFFGTIFGAGSYFDPVTLTRDNSPIRAGRDFYYTDAIADHAVEFIDEFAREKTSFFLYTAFTAPHFPLQAPAETIAKYQDRYATGWDALRMERHQKQIDLGIVNKAWALSPRDTRVPPWELAPFKEWEKRRMAVYAAQVERMDTAIGRMIDKLQTLNILDNTLIFFLADNGGNNEELPNPYPEFPLDTPSETIDGRLMRQGNSPSVLPGTDDTFQSYGLPWGNTSNTPFRYFKHFAHEGGISTPLIVHWPQGIAKRNALVNDIGHETDIFPTCLEVANVAYPSARNGKKTLPLVGETLAPLLSGQSRMRGPIFWEHEGNSAVRYGRWKLVSAYPDTWELHDMESDRTELNNIADQNLAQVKTMIQMYREWAAMAGVLPWPLPGRTPSGPSSSWFYSHYLDRQNVQ